MSDTASSGAMRMASQVICVEVKRVETAGLLAVVDGEYRREPLHPATGVVRWINLLSNRQRRCLLENAEVGRSAHSYDRSLIHWKVGGSSIRAKDFSPARGSMPYRLSRAAACVVIISR